MSSWLHCEVEAAFFRFRDFFDVFATCVAVDVSALLSDSLASVDPPFSTVELSSLMTFAEGGEEQSLLELQVELPVLLSRQFMAASSLFTAELWEEEEVVDRMK